MQTIMSDFLPSNRHRRGDPSAAGDGMVFFQYKHGKEIWLTPEQLAEAKKALNERSARRRSVLADNAKKPERLFRRGDLSPTGNGMVFVSYSYGWRESWTTPDKLTAMRESAKETSKKINAKHSRKAWRKQWAKKPETIARIEAKKQDPAWLKEERAKNNADQKKRRAESPSFRIAHNLRVRIRSAMIICGAQKAATTEALIGCSLDAFRLHIESQFKPGMTWEDRTAWHIDHVIPLSLFDLTKPEQQKIAFHYRNCRPEWKTVNLRKNDRVDGELFLGRHYKKPRTIIPFKAA